MTYLQPNRMLTSGPVSEQTPRHHPKPSAALAANHFPDSTAWFNPDDDYGDVLGRYEGVDELVTKCGTVDIEGTWL